MLDFANCRFVLLLAAGAVTIGAQRWATAQECAYSLDLSVGNPGLMLDDEKATAAYELLEFDDGSGPALYVCGGFDHAGGGTALGIARWDGQNWSALQLGLQGAVYDMIVWDDGTGPALYVGGEFDFAGLTPVNNVAKWDGMTWSAVGDGVQGGRVLQLGVFDDGTGEALYAGGYFDTAGEVQARGFAKWDGASWSEVGGGLSISVFSMASYNDGAGEKLYVSGYLFDAGPLSNPVPVRHIAVWDGQNWSDFNNQQFPGPGTAAVYDMKTWDDGTGEKLYIAGFANMQAVSVWDGQTLTPIGNVNATDPNNGGWAWDLMVYDDGTGEALYAAGAIQTEVGVAAIAKWDGANWSRVVGYYTYPAIWNGVAQEIAGFGDRIGLAGDFATASNGSGDFAQRGMTIVIPSCPCAEDFNGDGLRDSTDLSILLSNFGGTGTLADGDANDDGVIDSTDLSLLLGVFGSNCP